MDVSFGKGFPVKFEAILCWRRCPEAFLKPEHEKRKQKSRLHWSEQAQSASTSSAYIRGYDSAVLGDECVPGSYPGSCSFPSNSGKKRLPDITYPINATYITALQCSCLRISSPPFVLLSRFVSVPQTARIA